MQITFVHYWIPAYEMLSWSQPWAFVHWVFDCKQTGRVQTVVCSVFSHLASKCSALPMCTQSSLNFSHIELTPMSRQEIDTFWHRAVLWLKCNRNSAPFSAPNALWVFSRHDPIFLPYFNPVRGKLTNNTRISHCFYHNSSTFLA